MEEELLIKINKLTNVIESLQQEDRINKNRMEDQQHQIDKLNRIIRNVNLVELNSKVRL